MFASQEYSYDIRYLGCVPLAQCKDESVAAEAVELLFHKLDSIQQRAIDKAVEVKYGSRLSRASPMYQTVAKKLQKKGSDVTQGEEARLVVGAIDIVFADPKTQGKFIPLFSRDVELVSVVSKTAVSELLGLVLKGETKFFCHVFSSKPGKGGEIRETIMEARKFGKREYENAVLASTITKEKVVAKPSHTDKDTITLGIGFHHKSAVKISASLRANGKFKIPEQVPQAGSLGTINDDDEDSLDGVDEDMFTGTDELSSANTHKTPPGRPSVQETLHEDDGEMVRMNIENFGFDDELFGFEDE